MRLPIRGRGASHDPPNRFERVHAELDAESVADDAPRRTRFLADQSRSIISRNDSPDLGFDVSLNPYRGCEHGCCYCYARPTHEYLGFSAGLDFESQIMVKSNAAELLRDAVASPRWKPQLLALSGVTDAYQPIERRMGITRACLEVLAECRNPVGIVTKNHLVTRDIDVLSEMAKHRVASVTVSLTTLRNELQNVMEPRTSIPARRLAAIAELAQAGIPVGVNVAPVIPGLTDHEIPDILKAARDAGASYAAMMSEGSVPRLARAALSGSATQDPGSHKGHARWPPERLPLRVALSGVGTVCRTSAQHVSRDVQEARTERAPPSTDR